ncbi:MAG: phosphate transport system regulatory protein PhoU [Deltaproteobacteria bacterium]|nr:MAG: phosphate transport system regulatory protein PhoU [Deltaproteobacteria bacterium]
MREEYGKLRELIARMGSLAEEMIQGAITSLVEGDIDLARSIIEKDETMDRLDVEVDELCLKILALYEPKAVDLRYVVTALRIINDLERIGDHCVNICEEVVEISKLPRIKPYIDLPRMAEHTRGMLRDAVEAYFSRDISLAVDVMKRDNFVDDLNNQVIRELLTYLVEDLKKTKVAISLMFISNNFERIADHATNIAELVYFMVRGKIVRHSIWEKEEGEEDTRD